MSNGDESDGNGSFPRNDDESPAGRDAGWEALADAVQRRVLEFARGRLGPASEELLARPSARAEVAARLAAGRDVEDAVLAVVHAGAASDRALADEFLRYFLDDVLHVGKSRLSEQLRRFSDTRDLAQSVLGDVWPILGDLSFTTRVGFLRMLATRLEWKASGKARHLKRAKRREDKRVPESVEELQLASRESSPLVQVQDREERLGLVLALMRLERRDRKLVVMSLQELSYEEIASRFGLKYDAARKAVRRALRRLEELLGRPGKRGDGPPPAPG